MCIGLGDDAAYIVSKSCTPMQVLHSGDLICEGIIKQQAEPAKAEEPKKEEPAAEEPATVPTAQPVAAAGVTANIAVISVSRLSLLQDP